jgi:hypothetical protein
MELLETTAYIFDSMSQYEFDRSLLLLDPNCSTGFKLDKYHRLVIKMRLINFENSHTSMFLVFNAFSIF